MHMIHFVSGDMAHLLCRKMAFLSGGGHRRELVLKGMWYCDFCIVTQFAALHHILLDTVWACV